jgi:hypothetical protein
MNAMSRRGFDRIAIAGPAAAWLLPVPRASESW